MTPMKASDPNRMSCDLLVVGSGASGLAAAVTAAWHGLRGIVVEKDAVFGGATAWSGGWMWVPGNPLADLNLMSRVQFVMKGGKVVR